MTTNQHQEILRTEGLSKFFPGVKALDNVDFSLRRGEIMALLGENGAGKSTLIKALTGVYHADRGTIWLEGQAISPKNTAHAQQLGIGTVYQEVNLLPNMSVADNLFIGREPKRFGLLRRKEMEKRATELMASYGFSLDVREPLNRFSVAMQQIVAICRAIDLSAKVLILDEPTASLDTQEVELLFDASVARSRRQPDFCHSLSRSGLSGQRSDHRLTQRQFRRLSGNVRATADRTGKNDAGARAGYPRATACRANIVERQTRCRVQKLRQKRNDRTV